jgi:hypothetical protein
MRIQLPTSALFVCLLLLMSITVRASDVWHVSTSGDNGGPGSNDLPFETIQHALNSAASSDTIRVYDGIYAGSGNRDLSFLGKSLVLMSVSDSPDLCVIDCGGTAVEHHRGFLFSNGEDSSCVVRGLTIQNGYAEYGGGILCIFNNGDYYPDQPLGNGGRVQVVNCILTANTATVNGGGTAAIGNPSALSMRQCHILDNIGSGAYWDQWSGSDYLQECLFENNSSDGAWLSFSSWPTDISDCIFVGNGGHGIGWSQPWGNRYNLIRVHAENNGGYGVYDGGNPETWLMIVDSVVNGNIAGGVFHGGTGSGSCQILDSVISENGGPGLTTSGLWNVEVRRTTIANNNGTGIDCYSQHLLLEEITVSGNAGSGIIVSGEHIPDLGPAFFDIHDVTISDNGGDGYKHNGYGGPVIVRALIMDNEGVAIDPMGTEQALLACSNLHGNQGGDWVGNYASLYGIDGNDSRVALFCDTDSGDFTLQANSPLLDPDIFACGVPGALGEGCLMPTYNCFDLQNYDPITRISSDEMMNVQVRVEGVVSVEPGTYGVGSGGYLSTDTGGINFWHWDYGTTLTEGDHVTLTGDVWVDGNDELYIGGPVISQQSSGPAPTPILTDIPDLVNNFSLTGSFVVAHGAVTNLGPDAFDLEWGGITIPVVRRDGTNVSFSGLTVGNIVNVTGPCIHGAAEQFLSPRRMGDVVILADVGVDDSSTPTSFRLLACSPNPFNPVTTIRFELPLSEQVELIVYDVSGRMIAKLIHGEVLAAGYHEMQWFGLDSKGIQMPSGVYLCVIRAGDFHGSQRMVLLK